MGLAREYTKNEFEELYGIECKDKFRIDAGYVYDLYYANIYPNLALITKYFNKEKPITQEELRILFKVGIGTWKACKYYFSELKETLGHKRDIMKFKSEIDLQQGIELSPTNPKLLEMQFRLYNDEWKDKSSSVDLRLPETLKIEVCDDSLDEEELFKFDPVEINKEKD